MILEYNIKNYRNWKLRKRMTKLLKRLKYSFLKENSNKKYHKNIKKRTKFIKLNNKRENK